MNIIYTTLNNEAEARAISHELLEKRLANCTNWFPIHCMYHYEGKIADEPEVVLLIKTMPEKYTEIEAVIKNHIDYDNFIGLIPVEKVNDNFASWLHDVVG